MEAEMAMRSTEDIEIAETLTPPLPPLSFSLYNSSLSSHCSSCFHSLSSPLPTTTTTTFLRYCSNGVCSSIDTPLHFSSGEHHLFRLLNSHPSLWPHSDSSDLRASLRLFSLLSLSPPSSRLFGLLTNRRKILSGEEGSSARVRVGAKAMAMARAMRDGREFDDGGECELEEAVLCLIITNAVEINVNGERPIGIGVYDWRFSWINHSCSPNSCYRFIAAFEEGLESSEIMRIEPCGREIDKMEGFTARADGELAKGHGNYGPRVVVRSIKAIRSGEEATITYTDLLQPTTLRQSELFPKFQFICDCMRCHSVPQTYEDYALEEMFCTYCHDNSPSSIINHYREDAVERFRDVFDSTIMDYMEVGDPVSCCEKIEAILSQGMFDQHLEETRGVWQIDLRLSPLNHLSLNAYTTLSSTYKIRASESVGERFQSFDMSRISAAYSLLLAGATHHLFVSEPSFIASAATFWINAGECLLYLARSSSWNLFANCVSQNHSTIPNLNCPKCLLMDKFEYNFSSNETRSRELDARSREFLMCVSNMTPEVWSFLVRGCQYLTNIKDPIDFSWLESMRTSCMWDLNAQSLHHNFNLGSEVGLEGDLVKCDDGKPANERRANIFELGIHCLLYGGYLSCICYGNHHYRADCIRNVLHS